MSQIVYHVKYKLYDTQIDLKNQTDNHEVKTATIVLCNTENVNSGTAIRKFKSELATRDKKLVRILTAFI